MKPITMKNKLLILGLFACLGLNMSLERQTMHSTQLSSTEDQINDLLGGSDNTSETNSSPTSSTQTAKIRYKVNGEREEFTVKVSQKDGNKVSISIDRETEADSCDGEACTLLNQVTVSDKIIETTDSLTKIVDLIKKNIKDKINQAKKIHKEDSEELAKMKTCKLDLDGEKVDKGDRKECFMDLMKAYLDESHPELCDSDDDDDCSDKAAKVYTKHLRSWAKGGQSRDTRMDRLEDLLSGAFDIDIEDGAETDLDDDYEKSIAKIIRDLQTDYITLDNKDRIKNTIKDFYSNPAENYSNAQSGLEDFIDEDTFKMANGAGVSAQNKKNYNLLFNSSLNAYCQADITAGQLDGFSRKSFGPLNFYKKSYKYDSNSCGMAAYYKYPGVRMRTAEQVMNDLNLSGINAHSISDSGLRTQFGRDLGRFSGDRSRGDSLRNRTNDRNRNSQYSDRGRDPYYDSRNRNSQYNDRNRNSQYNDRNRNSQYNDRNRNTQYRGSNSDPYYGSRNGSTQYRNNNGSSYYDSRNGGSYYDDRFLSNRNVYDSRSSYNTYSTGARGGTQSNYQNTDYRRRRY